MSKRTVAMALGESGSSLRRATHLIANGIIEWAKHEDWELLELSSWNLQIPGSVKVDGLIYTQESRYSEKLEALTKLIPHSVNVLPSKRDGVAPAVTIDWQAVGQQAADYYLNRGFRSFALASYRTDEWTQSLRVFKRHIEQAGGRCEAIQGMHLAGSELDDIRDAVKQQLQDLTYPLGIFCANDRLAVRLCRWCIEEGISIPEQAAILGYGNDPLTCRSNPVPLSSINPDYQQHGIEAARLLQRMMDGESVGKDTLVLIPPRGIITRRSTDITAIADPRTARALRYIWDHYMDNIGPDDVAAFCGIPRRSLDRNFKKALGRTMSKEIMRQRFAKASELLVGTDMPAATIAAIVGFRTPQYFNYQFKRHFGLTPQRYRERERKKM